MRRYGAPYFASASAPSMSSLVSAPVSHSRLVQEFGWNARRADAALQADAAQHPHRIGAHLDAGAEPHELRRLFVDPHGKAALMQRRGEGQPAHSGADDRKRRPHVSSVFALLLASPFGAVHYIM